MADVLMGFLFVHRSFGSGNGWALGLLIAASSLLYMAGIALNDVFDYAVDLVERPERPLPSARIGLRTARWLGWTMLAVGVGLAVVAAMLVGQVRTAIVAGLLAASIVFYDAWLKRTLLGPLGMGACRMLNVLLGMSAAVGAWQAQHWLVAGAIGTYIVGVTWLARTEARRSRRLHLAGATLVMLAGIGLLASLPRVTDDLVALLQSDPSRWYLLMALLGALIGWRGLRAIVDPRSAVVKNAVGQSILSLVVLDAAACFAAQGTPGGVMVLLLLVPTMIIGQWLEAT
jgi:4-hydroxybenzoate polyprenyltransferase